MTSNNPFADRIARAAEEGYMPRTSRVYGATRRPAGTPFTGEDRATANQAELAHHLLTTKELTAEDRPKYRARYVELLELADNGALRTVLTKRQASALIEALLALPDANTGAARAPRPAADTPDVPAGRYAVEINGQLTFLRVDRPETGKWAGYTFVKRQAGGEFIRMTQAQRERALTVIGQTGVREAAIRYGHELGMCGICGRELTNEESRTAGIGPVCAAKNGW